MYMYDYVYVLYISYKFYSLVAPNEQQQFRWQPAGFWELKYYLVYNLL